MRILVTGGAGFIGSHLVDGLVEAGHSVAVVDNLSTGRRENLNPAARFYEIDIRSPELFKVMREEQPQVVYHLAAQPSVAVSMADPYFDADINVMGGIRLLQASAEAGVSRLVFSSTAAVYGTPSFLPVSEDHPVLPLSGYGLAKMILEHYIRVYCREYRMEYVICRYSNVYGERQDASGEGGVVAIFADRMLRGETPVIYGDGEQTRDFIYVGDVVQANILAMQAGSGKTLNISCGRSCTVNELYRILADLTGFKGTPRYEPPRPGDIEHSTLANDRAVRILGWRPAYSIQEGLEKTVRYWRI